ncbi:MAG: hypothetical protein ACE5D0_01675 [Fidelibacterota bacterium]
MQKYFKLIFFIELILSTLYPIDLIGTVKFIGKPPKQKYIRMDSDPVCCSSNQGNAYNQSLMVDENGNLANVIVYIKKPIDDREVPSEPVVLDQKGCMYSPHVVGVRAGQELLILNSDPTMHNVHGVPKLNPPFNFGMPKTVKEKSIIFQKAEGVFVVKCNVHPWMKSYIQVFDHSYFAITSTDGKYVITNIRPGEYEVVAWQEKFGSKKVLRKNITILNQTATLDFTFIRPNNSH